MKPDKKTISISFIGDISLNDSYIELYMQGVDPFKAIEPILASSDFVIGNLECMAKGVKGENELKKPRLATTVETLNFLKSIKLKVACLAHNHVYDHLEDGYLKTTDFLKNNNIKYLGAGLSPDEAKQTLTLDQDDITIGLLNYVARDTNPNLPEGAGIYLNMFDIERCKKDIMQLRQKVNHAVLLLHWGGRVEGGLYPDWNQPKIARELIDAGADLIIGHHSHTIQPYEVYKGRYIFYSLGNFCFSDFIFEGKYHDIPVRRRMTLLVRVLFSTNDYKVSLMTYKSNITHYEGKPNYQRNIIFKNYVLKYVLSFYLFWQVYYFNMRVALPLLSFLNRNDMKPREKIIRLWKFAFKRIIIK